MILGKIHFCAVFRECTDLKFGRSECTTRSIPTGAHFEESNFIQSLDQFRQLNIFVCGHQTSLSRNYLEELLFLNPPLLTTSIA